MALKPGRRKRLEMLIEPDTQFSEQTERRLVRDHALDIATDGPQHGKATDGGSRGKILDLDGADPCQRHRCDEPAGQGKEADIGKDHNHVESNARSRPARVGSAERQQAKQIPHASKPAGRPITLA